MRVAGIVTAVALIVAGVSVSNCAKKTPLDRPLKLGAVETGAGTVADVRKRLEGAWELVSVTVVQPAAPVEIKANGRLTYDAFGNLSVKGRITSPSDPSVGALLDYEGLAIIDSAKQQLRLTGVASRNDAPPPGDLSFDKLRAYSFEGDQLKISTLDAAGRVVATAVWKRAR